MGTTERRRRKAPVRKRQRRRSDELRFISVENRLTILEKHHTSMQQAFYAMLRDHTRDIANLRAEFQEKISGLRDWLGTRFDTLERITRVGINLDEDVKGAVVSLDENVRVLDKDVKGIVVKVGK